MNHLILFLKLDLVLLNRNRLFAISALIALLYTAVFYLLSSLGNLDILAVVLIFNDPVVTGYMFAGILLLFDKNQGTLQAISVLPATPVTYLLSKALVLCVLAVVVAFVMAFATKGIGFNPIHLFFSVFLSTAIFSFFGFIVATLSKSFNHFLFYSIPFLILCGLPFLPVFGYGNIWQFLLLPSTGGVILLKAGFDQEDTVTTIAMYLHLCFWSVVSGFIALKTMKGKLL